VRLAAVPGREDPVPFGMVLWSTPPSISLLVGQDAGPASFTRDWVAVHELLHLAHPPILPRVAWLSEGLATYYTELARARSGRQSPERAWTELLAGFARARRAVGSRTMEDVVTRGDSYLGTYWTGALVALHLDVELRRVTGNARGLDAVLERLAESGPVATFEDFGVAVDAIAGRPLFQEVVSRHLSQPALAELEPLLEALGVESVPDGARLGAARDSPLRDALVAPR
jgi:predicted metalloprotease with PDZ domain